MTTFVSGQDEDATKSFTQCADPKCIWSGSEHNHWRLDGAPDVIEWGRRIDASRIRSTSTKAGAEESVVQRSKRKRGPLSPEQKLVWLRKCYYRLGRPEDLRPPMGVKPKYYVAAMAGEDPTQQTIDAFITHKARIQGE